MKGTSTTNRNTMYMKNRIDNEINKMLKVHTHALVQKFLNNMIKQFDTQIIVAKMDPTRLGKNL